MNKMHWKLITQAKKSPIMNNDNREIEEIYTKLTRYIDKRKTFSCFCDLLWTEFIYFSSFFHLFMNIAKNVEKVNESRYKQCGVTLHFSTGQYLLKKILRKDKHWHYKLRKAFWYNHWTQIMQYIVHDSLTL